MQVSISQESEADGVERVKVFFTYLASLQECGLVEEIEKLGYKGGELGVSVRVLHSESNL